MKVLLINPPRENEIIGNNPSIIEEERGVNPPLGLLYIAGYLQKFTNHIVNIIDAQVEKLNYENLSLQISLSRPDVVGITVMTLTLIDVMKTINIIKRVDNNIKIVLGGPHAHLFPEETISLNGVDYLVLGEGEETFKELLDCIDNKRMVKGVKGVVFKDDGAIIINDPRPLINDLDGIPFPARHLVPYRKYTSLLSKGDCVTTIFTSRGCPFKCSFCDRPHLGKMFRSRSAKNVVDELEECVDMGIDEFLFYDDTFTVDKNRVLDICGEIIRRKLDIGFDIRSRIDTINEEVICQLKKAGCQGIHYGVEAGTEKVLKVLNKAISLQDVQEIFKTTKKYKIPILAYFMIGNPSETLEDIRTTFKVIKKLNPDYIHLTIFTPFPGTKIYFDGLKSGYIDRDYWREFAINPTENFIPPIWTESFNRLQLNELLIEGYRNFYLRPKYIVDKIISTPSLSAFKKQFKAGIKLFKRSVLNSC